MKKWIALSLSLIMALSLCACGKDDAKDPTAAPTDAPTTPTTENNGGENNNGEENNGNTDSGNFSLMTDMVIRYGEGDDSESMELEMIYDDDCDVIGYKVLSDGKLYSEVTCDKNTYKPLKQIDYSESGTMDGTYEYTYDEKGNELTVVSTDGEGTVLYSAVNTYTPEGWIASSVCTVTEVTGGYVAYEQYTYDDQGNPLTYVSGSGDEVWANTTYENLYEDGKLTEIKVYQHGRLSWSEHYNADGNMVEERNYDDEGNVYAQDTYTYENGKLLLRVMAYDGEESFREEYTYNDAGQLTEMRSIDEGVLHGRNVYTYENGVLVNVKLYDHEELECAYTLSYKKADVSEERAEKLTALYALMLED